MHHDLGRERLYVNNTWGQTELAGCPLAGAAWLTPMKRGSCGIEFLGDVVDIVDDDGQPVAAGTPGNLIVKKAFPMMIRTLWKDHERYLNEYFRKIPGCYFTYDGAVRDEDGHYWVLGRLDDVFNVAGHRLSTMEIENALLTCPEVSEAAVVEYPDSIKGAVPAAFLRLKTNHFEPLALKSHVCQAVEMGIGKIAIATGKLDRCRRSILRSHVAGCGMCPCAYVQYPGIVFPRLDRLRRAWHLSHRWRPLVFCAHQARG